MSIEVYYRYHMNTKYIEARENIIKAREALRRGDKKSARQLGEQAALLAPEMEDACPGIFLNTRKL